MEAMAIVLMLMKADHSMMELGKYKSIQQCEQAMQIAKTQFKKGHLSCIKDGEKMKH
jgi:uncharacterized membrane protein